MKRGRPAMCCTGSWQEEELGVQCEVIAPSLVPVKAGDRVEDRSARRREAGAKLPIRRSDSGLGSGRGFCRRYAIWCVRVRRAAKQDQLRSLVTGWGKSLTANSWSASASLELESTAPISI